MVYLIGYQDDGVWLVKIGIAANPVHRLRQLQTGNSHRLSILKAIGAVDPRRVESGLHRQFRHYRQAGEWFRMDWGCVQTLEATMDRLAI